MTSSFLRGACFTLFVFFFLVFFFVYAPCILFFWFETLASPVAGHQHHARDIARPRMMELIDQKQPNLGPALAPLTL